jgi:hypothetical protein
VRPRINNLFQLVHILKPLESSALYLKYLAYSSGSLKEKIAYKKSPRSPSWINFNGQHIYLSHYKVLAHVFARNSSKVSVTSTRKNTNLELSIFREQVSVSNKASLAKNDQKNIAAQKASNR